MQSLWRGCVLHLPTGFIYLHVLPKCTQHALPRLILLTKIAWQITFLISQLYFEFTRKPLLEKNNI